MNAAVNRRDVETKAARISSCEIPALRLCQPVILPPQDDDKTFVTLADVHRAADCVAPPAVAMEDDDVEFLPPDDAKLTPLVPERREGVNPESCVRYMRRFPDLPDYNAAAALLRRAGWR